MKSFHIDHKLEIKMKNKNFWKNVFLNIGYYLCYLYEWLRVMRSAIKVKISISAIKKSKSESVKNYCAYNREAFNNYSNRGDRIILMDCCPIPQWVIANSFLVNKLSVMLDASIVSYGLAGRDTYIDNLYQSFGCNQHLLVKTKGDLTKERKRLYQMICESIKSKDDLFNFKINGVWIGLDIYESILRTGVPTVDINSFRTRYQIFHALKYYVYFLDFFSSGAVQSVVLSHDNYISMGLVAKIAFQNNVPLFVANPFELIKVVRTHQVYERYAKYPDYFNLLPELEKKNAVLWAKGQLEKRVKGVVGVNMSYQEKSAFTDERIARQTLKSDKTKIVIATHCFFDNPHGYGWMLFSDFYEWLCFLGEISKETDYEWYLKSHPDYLPGTLETLTKITEMYPKLRLIDPATTFHQLKEEGVSVVLTCYGSVGHELPLLGYKVINAAYNPHIAYDFNWHPETLEQYRDMLLNLKSLGDVRDVEKIYEFFYIHKVLTQSDDFLFSSYDQLLADAGGNSMSVAFFDAFLSQKDVVRTKADEKMNAFLLSDKTYYFEIGAN